MLIETKKFIKQFQDRLNAKLRLGRKIEISDIEQIFLYIDDLKEALERYIMENTQFEIINTIEAEEYIKRIGIADFLFDCKEFFEDYYGYKFPTEYLDPYRLVNFHVQETARKILNELIEEYN